MNRFSALRSQAIQSLVPVSFFLIVGISICFCNCSQAQNPSAASEEIDYSPPVLESEDSWSVILLPDPQAYVKFERNQALLELMTSWISENIDRLNIKFVMCTGDLVEDNNLSNPDGVNANQTSTAQWESVSRAFSRLDGKVPYITATGNHDYGVLKRVDSKKTNFTKYFPINKNTSNKAVLRDVALNDDGIPTLENASYEFTSPQGRKFLMLSLEFAPRNSIIEWAKELISRDQYENHTVGILTHYYMSAKNEYLKANKWDLPDANYGEDIWKKLVKPSRNIQLVFAGHIGKADDPRGHIAFREDLNARGKKVHQMVFNAQGLGGGFDGNGGDGWLRILEFLPDGKTVRVKTFSPFFAISPSTNRLAWRKENYDEFTFRMD